MLDSFDIVLASNNANKRIEISNIFKTIGLHQINIILPEEILGYEIEIEEYGKTLEENAFIKSSKIFELTNKNVISDDTGLEINYLNASPGVYSARFAGFKCSDEDNRRKVLDLLEGIETENRTARFRTIICFIEYGMPIYFEGICNGVITTAERGENGFGYDPVFQPIGYCQTFAEMESEFKNSISHRYIAIKKLAEYLKNQLLKGNST